MPAPTVESLSAAVHALTYADQLDAGMREFIVSALNYLGYRLICDSDLEQLSKRGRHHAAETRRWALVAKVLVLRYGVSVKTAALCSIERTDATVFLSRVRRAHSDICKNGSPFRNVTEAMFVAAMLEPAVRVAANKFDK